jgi:hypothetical protein
MALCVLINDNNATIRIKISLRVLIICKINDFTKNLCQNLLVDRAV